MTVPNPTPDADDAMSEAVEVIQADREACAAYVAKAFGLSYAKSVMEAGRWPDLTQAFARHRLAASERDAAREAGARALTAGLDGAPSLEVMAIVIRQSVITFGGVVQTKLPEQVADALLSIPSPEAPATKPHQSAGDVERMREALRRLASDVMLCPRHNRGGVLDAHIDAIRDAARAALTDPMGGVTETGEIPEGWKLVPVEPTGAMLRQAAKSRGYSGIPPHDDWLTVYHAMLAASPSSPVSRMEEGS